MPTLPDAADQHYRQIQKLEILALGATRRAWGRIDERFLSESWNEQIVRVLPAFVAIQQRAAFEGGTYAAMSLAEQGQYVAPVEFTAPQTFAGYASDGRPLGSLLYSPIIQAKSLIGGGLSADTALRTARKSLDRITITQVADVARQAAGADLASRPGTGYVRMVSAKACARCIVLAGRFYRWNAGFLRHPQCLCQHVATRVGDQAEAYANGLMDDPYKVFESMSGAEQAAAFGQYGAQAIRDGADISQVVNSRRGMTKNGLFTSEGTRYGNARRGLRPGQRRLTPEGIYDQASRFGHGRDWTIDRLREHGYVLPPGQVSGGALRGQREGWGQLGGGGQRRAAREAIEEARRTGVRDPRNRYTMTAAERRLYDAQMRYETALSGYSPYTSPGFGNAPDPYGRGLNRAGVSRRPVTQIELARAEREYRAYLASGGQVFTR
ncbi:hypothetical protein [Aeromicrobium piscarium]|uniref:MuF-like minor capsid protein n=1 Tax=Aeromicrobium piscarium TaxID=2590901 RepID=A0A554SP43_9ACTN|nr:hypothetical protein [Aeromicrobium piscarium]TSD68124.1 hypothetical protein FNM00_00570 [Aeromicrobium piscarium]